MSLPVTDITAFFSFFLSFLVFLAPDSPRSKTRLRCHCRPVSLLRLFFFVSPKALCPLFSPHVTVQRALDCASWPGEEDNVSIATTVKFADMRQARVKVMTNGV